MKIRSGFLILLLLLVLLPVSAFASTWAKSYGGSSNDYARSIQQTSDDGFIVAGSTLSYGAGFYDIWVLKLDADGNIIWQKTYGGGSANTIQQTTDGGFVVASSRSVLKLDTNGDITWQKTYGGSDYDRAYSIQQTSDGGFIVAGDTNSYGAGYTDLWVLKLDANGNIPGCNIIQDAFVVPVNISKTRTINTSLADTNATVTNTAVVPINTAATVELQCFHEEPELTTQDLGYAPVSPCRIVDTRLAGGAITPGTIRGYNVWGDVASQGGNPAGCPLPLVNHTVCI